MYDMTRLIVLKCRKINDFVGLLNAVSEDNLGYGVDLENNTIFTSEVEIMTKNLENLYEFLSRDPSVRGQWIRYYIDYMPIWDSGNPGIDVRSEILKKCKKWEDYKLEDLLYSIQGSSPRQIDLGSLSGLGLIPDKLKVFIGNSGVFYKTWDSQREYIRQIDLDLPLFEDSPVMFPYCPENTIRDALKHLLNFSYPGERSDENYSVFPDELSLLGYAS